MSYKVAILLPPAALLSVGRRGSAILAVLLCITVVGWLPAALWALLVVNRAKASTAKRDKFIRDNLGRRARANSAAG